MKREKKYNCVKILMLVFSVKNKKSDYVVAGHSSTDLGFCLFVFPSLIPNYSFFFSRLLILLQ